MSNATLIDTIIANSFTDSKQIDIKTLRKHINRVLNDYLYMYWSSKCWTETYWHGYKSYKFATDLIQYQQIIYDVKPDFIIETGIMYGGTTFFLAHMLDLIGHGIVIGIDINKMDNLPEHNRISYIFEDCLNNQCINRVNEILDDRYKKGLVILDSDHNMSHVLKEMNLYKQYVSVGSYLIVEDTDISGHPLQIFDNKTNQYIDPGPYEAVHAFLKDNKDFEIDDSREDLILTNNPDGFLRRINA